MNFNIFDQYVEIIPEFSDFQKRLRHPIPVHLRVNRLKIEPPRLLKIFREKGIHLKRVAGGDDTLYWAPDLKSPGNLLEYFLGYFHPQALTSCLAPMALSTRQGAFVLDMCASPGGKTAQMAQMMNNTGLVIANELFPGRHIPLAHTLSRLGVLNTILTAYQAQEFPLRERFDYVLADVPCSGEGRFRMIGEKTRYMAHKVKRKLQNLQKRIILRGFDLLKDKGEMVYSTCTYNPEENESVVHFLLKNRAAELLPINIDFKHETGLPQWRREKYDGRLEKAARFYPHQIDSVGFFMARIGRRG